MRFIEEADFESLDGRYAQVPEGPVVAARQRLRKKLLSVHHRFLKKRMEAQALHAHWDPTHLTSLIYPDEHANGGYVDYLRLGYGKPRELVKDLGRRGGFTAELMPVGVNEHLPFFMTSQLQIGIQRDHWWINFFMHSKGWLEQNNLLEKIACREYRDELTAMLTGLQDEGYRLALYPGWNNHNPPQFPSEPKDFLLALAQARDRGEAVEVSVEMLLVPDDIHNDIQVWPEFVANELERLVSLYRFASWHPKDNNFLSKL
jgi:hypothetical protein